METAPISSSFIDCHAEQHCWQRERWLVSREVGWTPPLGMPNAIGRLFTCTECGTQKARWYNPRGEVKTTYHYAEGYLHARAKGDQRPAPRAGDYRIELVNTVFRQRGVRDEVAAKRRKQRRAS
jgi:hypothetical protein